jgi:hypothetical protein
LNPNPCEPLEVGVQQGKEHFFPPVLLLSRSALGKHIQFPHRMDPLLPMDSIHG